MFVAIYAPDMDEEDSPFAHIPEPGVVYEQPSRFTLEGEIALYGDIARNAAGVGAPRWRRVAVAVLLLLILGISVLGIVTMYFGD
jgi:hypothetical protein